MKVVAAGLDPDTVCVGDLVIGMAVITIDADDTGTISSAPPNG